MNDLDSERTYPEDDERRARIELMAADTENKRGLLRYEPWKVAFTAFGAGAAFIAALVALLAYFEAL